MCDSTLRALKDYGGRKKAEVAKEGKGLSEALADRLKSKDNDTRRAALRELITGYMNRGYDRSTISAEQRKVLEDELLKMRGVPKGNGSPDSLKFCPSCDGACRLLPQKP